ncbi:cytochrome P450 3A30 [Corynespora cassiicola Philippines]|uniref:Cytochrome P450 3A30 n=1 Tax=Corynespora cassiicola Philippines TaxID=1448308 RepID=A0A2T2P704_CORCC|nr:cytochrome P450 3A30 [Corynespora cassiicola Philippines]
MTQLTTPEHAKITSSFPQPLPFIIFLNLSNWFQNVFSQILSSLVTASLVLFLARFLNHRRIYKKLPGPPHNFFWGHLKIYGETMALFPPRSHFQAVITTLAHKYHLPGLFYMDLWPLGPEQLIITDPRLATQYVTNRKLPKHQLLADYLDPILGKGNIITVNGTHWKSIHDLLSPAFSVARVLDITTLIADDIMEFHNVISEIAVSKTPFRLEEKINALVFDIIFKAIFGVQSRAQTVGSDDLRDLNSVVNADMTGKQTWDPIRRIQLAKEKALSMKRLNDSIATKVKSRFKFIQQNNVSIERRQSLSILDLILQEYVQEASKVSALVELSPDIMEMAVPNIKALMLAGSGTTADTLCFMFMQLSILPKIVEKLREEHRRVYSSDVATTLGMLKSDPKRLRELKYSTNVIKETLRIYPIGNTGRVPDEPGCITYQGKEYPTKRQMLICPVQHTWHMDPDVFHDPDTFDPDRFNDMDKDYQVAWRPFERGNRACLGQTLAMEEMKMILLLTVQYFDFKCHDLKPNSSPRVSWTKMDTIFGDRAFQEFLTEARPRDGMPMMVTKAEFS